MRILLVEDEFVVALDLQATLEDWGHAVTGPVGTLGEAEALAREAPLDAAILDINLGDDQSFPAAEILMSRGIPVLFATGYEHLQAPENLRRVPRLTKPIDIGALQAHLERIFVAIQG